MVFSLVFVFDTGGGIAQAATQLGNANTTLTNGGDYVFPTGTTSWSGRTYTVAANANVTVTVPAGATVTINNTASGGSPFTLNSGATLNLIVNGTLKVYGQNGGDGIDADNGTTTNTAIGGYAGISVPTGTNLVVSGVGTLYSYGGDAGDGGDSLSTTHGTYYPGGGAGAGAGIGGNGGNGGNGFPSTMNLDASARGEDGKPGISAGAITLGGFVKVYAYGGGGASGGSELWGDGGAGGGYPAAGIGGGGGGGAAGNGGTGAGGFSSGGSAFAILGGRNGLSSERTIAPHAVTTNRTVVAKPSGGYFSVYTKEVDRASNPGGIGGYASSGDTSVNPARWVPNSGGAAGNGGTVKIRTLTGNVKAYNGAYMTEQTSQYYISNNVQTMQTPIYAQLGYSVANLRELGVTNAAGRTGTFTFTNSAGTTVTASNTKITKTGYGLGIGSGAGVTETSNGTVTYEYQDINLETLTADTTLTERTDGKMYRLYNSTTKYNVTIGSGTVGVLLDSATIDLSGTTGKSALAVASGAKAVVEVRGTSKLYGGNASEAGDGPSETQLSGGTGAGAGIAVPSGATLEVVGEGTLYAYGGDASDGGNGAGNAQWTDVMDYGWLENSASIANTAGGGGGGGAGAGIGGAGGAGGAGGEPIGRIDSESVYTDMTQTAAHNGKNGSAGGAAGTITINAKVYAYGGGGGSGGYSMVSCHGGAGGGGGYPGAGVGGGGAGGGGGYGGHPYITTLGTNGVNASAMGGGGGGGFSGGAGGGHAGLFYGGTDGHGGEPGNSQNSQGHRNGQYYGGGGGGYFSAGKAPTLELNFPVVNGAIYGGGGATSRISGYYIGGNGGAGGSGGTIVIVDNSLVKAYNGSKITTSSSATQKWATANVTPIRTQSTQGYGAGAGYTETAGTLTMMGAPGAPTGVAAALTTTTASTEGNDVTVSWTAPTNTGGTGVSLTGYTVVSEAFCINKTYALSELTRSGTSVSLSLTDLPSNTEGTFTVYAVNAKGVGSGTASNSVTTKGAPLAPQKILVDIGEAEHNTATVYWSAPDMSYNNIPLTGYTITFSPVGQADTMTDEKLDIAMEEDENGMEQPAPWQADAVTVTVGATPTAAPSSSGYSYVQEITGLKYGTVYTVLVAAMNAVGTGEAIRSQGETASVASAPTVSLTRQDDESGTPSGMDVSWTTPENAEGIPAITGYLVQRTALDNGGNEVAAAGKTWQFNYDSASGSWKTADGVTLTVTGEGQAAVYAFVDNEAKTLNDYRYGHSFKYSVAGVNVAGTGLYGDALYSFEPSAPTITKVEQGIRELTISFTPPVNNGNEDILSYNIYRNGVKVDEVDHISMTATHSYTDTGLANGTEYTYTIKAVNASGEGAESAAMKQSTYDVPGELRSLSMKGSAKDQIEVRWKAAVSDGGQEVQGYRITWSRNNEQVGSEYLTLSQLVPSGNPDEYIYTVKNLAEGTTYDFEVVAVNAVGDGRMPEEGNYFATTWTRPTYPLSFKVDPVEDGTGELVASWAAPNNTGFTDILSYNLYVFEAGAEFDATKALQKYNVPYNQLSYQIEGLASGTEYDFYVAAVNGLGEGATAMYSATAKNTPYPPETFTGEATWSNSVSLNWSAANPNGGTISHYVVDVVLEGTVLTSGEAKEELNAEGKTTYTYVLSGNRELVVTYDGERASAGTEGRNVLGATVTGLEKGTRYEFRVTSVNEVGPSQQPASREVRTMIEPFAVSNLEAVPVNESGRVKATWGLPSDTGETPVTEYVVSIYEGSYGAEDSLPSAIQTETIPASDPTEQEFTGLTDGTTYTVVVYAVNQIGDGIPSYRTVVPRKPAAAPEVSVQIKNGTEAEVIWLNPNDLGGDEILAGSDGYLISIYNKEGTLVATSKEPGESGIGFGTAVVDEEDSTKRTVLLTGLTMGTEYKVMVNAITGAGLGANSNVVDFTTWKISGGVANPSADATNYTGGIVMSWAYPMDDGDSDTDPSTNTGNNTGATDYKVLYRVSGSSEPWTELLWSSQTGEAGGMDGDRYFVKVTGLTDGQDYDFKVLVENGAGWSEDGAVVTTHPRFKPTAATIGEVKTGNESATITTIDLPAEIVDGKPGNGGDLITGYKIYAAAARQDSDGNWIATETPKYKNTVTLPEDDNHLPIQQQMTNVKVEGLENGVDYLITVRAMNGACVDEQADGGLASNAQYVRVGMPLAPENLTVGLGTGNSIVARYSAAEGNGSPILYYHVYMNDKVYTLEMQNGQLVDTGSAIRFQTLVSTVYGTMMGEPMKIQVSAVNKVGESPLTEAAEIIIGAPTTPEIDKLTMHADKVNLTWTEAQHNGSRLLGYAVYLTDLETQQTTRFPAEGSYISERTLDVAATVEDAAQLVPGHEYRLQVTATNLAGESPRSTARYFTFGVPQAPSITGIDFGTGELTTRFQPSTDTGMAPLERFHVYANERTEPLAKLWVGGASLMPEGYVMAELAEGSSTEYEVTLTGLANGSTYSIQVSAWNTYGESALSDSWSETPATIAGAPGAVKAVAVSDTEATLTWATPAYNGGSSVTGYVVTVYDAETGSAVEQTEGGVTVTFTGTENPQTAASISGLSKAKKYYFEVQATTRVPDPGTPGRSNTVTTFTNPGAPVIKTWTSSVMSDGSTLYSLQVKWEAPESDGGSPILGYNVYSSNAKQNGSVLVNADTNTFTINGLQYSRTYEIVIEAVNAVGSTKSVGQSVKIGQASMPEVTKIYTEVTDTQGIAHFYWNPVAEKADGYAIFNMKYIMNDILGKNYTDDQLKAMTSSEVTEVFNDTKNRLTFWDAEMPVYGATANYSPIYGLNVGETYYYALASFTSLMGVGMATEVYAVTVGAPDAPEINSAKGGYNSVKLDWQVPQNLNGNTLIGYQLYVDEVKHGEMIPVDAEGMTSDGKIANYAFPVDPALCGKEASFAITAISQTSDGSTYESLKSKRATATLWTNPSIPEDLTLAAGNATFTATFEKSNGNGLEVAGYKVFWDDNEVEASRVTSVDNGDGTITLTVTGVRNGYKYETTGYPVFVAAYTEDEEGTQYLSAVPDPMPTIATGIPAAPEIRSAIVSYDATFNKNAISLGYVDTEIITGETNRSYRIKMWKSNTDEESAFYIETGDTSYEITTYHEAELKIGESYRISVQAKNDFGLGLYSDEILVTLGAPRAPLNVAAIPGKNMATVTWTEPNSNAGPITMYEIHVKGEDGSEQIIEIDKNELSGEVEGLTNGMTYTVTVVAINDYGKSVESIACKVTPGTEPSAPASAKADALSDTAVKVSWTEPEDDGGMPVTYYVIAGGGQEIVHNASQALSVEVDNLKRGETYTFTVRAYNEIGGSVDVATTDPVTTHSLPGKPSWESLDSSDSTIIAKWNPPTNDGGSGIVSYTMYISRFDNDGVTLIPVYTIEDIIPTELDYDPLRGFITYTVPKDEYSFDIGTEYKVSIAAKNGTIDEVGEPSDNLSVTVVKGVIASVPGVPTGISATAGDGQATVNWSAPSYDGGIGIDNYYIYYRQVGVETYEKVQVPVNSRSATIKGLENGKTYEFYVAAANTEGESALSFGATATPIYIAAPNTPTNLSYVSNTSNTIITFRWDAVDDAERYQVFVNNSTDVPTAVVTTPYLEISAAVGTTYTLEVAAVNDGGISGRAQIKAQSTLNVDMDGNGVLEKGTDLYLDVNPYDGVQDEIPLNTVPSAPLNVTADISGTSINLSWTEPENKGGEDVVIDYYKLYVDGLEQDDEISGTSHTMSNITVGKIYTFQVAAHNSEGLGARSDTLQVYVPATTAPSNLQMKDLSNYTSLTLQWDPPTAVNRTPDHYKIQRNGLDTDSKYNDTEATMLLELDKEYVFRVYAVYADGETSKTTEPLLVSTIVPTPAAPAIETTVVSVSDTTRGIQVDFDEVENATAYHLYVDNQLVNENFTSGAVYTPETAGAYSIYVVAVNSVSDTSNTVTKTSDKSNIVIANTAEKAEGEPDQVLNLTAEVTNDERTQVTLTWDAVAAVDGAEISYVVYEAMEQTAGVVPDADQFGTVGEAEVIDNLDGTMSCVLNVTPNQVFYYQVAAVATVTGSEPITGVRSNVAQVSTKPDLPVPTAPDGVEGDYTENEDGSITITLSWAANDSAEEVDGYWIYGEVNGELQKLNDSLWTDTTYTYEVAAGSDKTDYLFQISAENATGEGAKSALSVNVEPDEPVQIPPSPDDPAGVRYVLYVDMTARKATVTLYWKAPDGESTSNPYVDAYKILLNNKVVVNQSADAFTYNETTKEYSYALDCNDADNPIEMLVLNPFSIQAIAHVPESDEDGAATSEVSSGGQNYNITYGLNEDTDGDGKANKNPDNNCDGVVDENVLTIKLNGTVSASNSADIPLTFTLTKGGEAVDADRYSVEVTDGAFVIDLTVAATATASEDGTVALADTSTYELMISKSGCLSHTITGIPIDASVESVELGAVELLVGDVNNDGIIDALDKGDVNDNFMKSAEERTNPLCDINNDTVIDALDKGVIRDNFMKLPTVSAYSAQ